MSDNVLILGAGASFDANIPLLSQFFNKMLEFSRLGVGDQFKSISEITEFLAPYHRGANFDDRNIEDVLSILSFLKKSGNENAKSYFDDLVICITETIEKCCRLKSNFSPDPNDPFHSNSSLWYALFSAHVKSYKLPTIITFNYDLVVERDLLYFVNSFIENHHINDDPLIRNFLDNLKNIQINYSLNKNQKVNLKITKLNNKFQLEESIDEKGENGLEINILKLHGSVNFLNNNGDITCTDSIFNTRKRPVILPPIYNKESSDIQSVWTQALKVLGEAKTVTFIGYSFPKTDIYFQFFLKAALGASMQIDKINVFDPQLFSNSEDGKSMQGRYEACFNQQLLKIIDFSPKLIGSQIDGISKGTLSHFKYNLKLKPQCLFHKDS